MSTQKTIADGLAAITASLPALLVPGDQRLASVLYAGFANSEKTAGLEENDLLEACTGLLNALHSLYADAAETLAEARIREELQHLVPISADGKHVFLDGRGDRRIDLAGDLNTMPGRIAELEAENARLKAQIAGQQRPDAAAGRLRVALMVCQQGLQDWMTTYADDMVGEEALAGAQRRIERSGGTLAYIAGLLQTSRQALNDTEAAASFWNAPAIGDLVNALQAIEQQSVGDTLRQIASGTRAAAEFTAEGRAVVLIEIMLAHLRSMSSALGQCERLSSLDNELVAGADARVMGRMAEIHQHAGAVIPDVMQMAAE